MIRLVIHVRYHDATMSSSKFVNLCVHSVNMGALEHLAVGQEKLRSYWNSGYMFRARESNLESLLV